MTDQRWLVYALGGGLGHLTRALSLARVAIRRGCRPTVVTNSPFVDAIPAEAELQGRGEILRLDPSLSRSEVSRRIESIFRDAAFDLLVVDAFPRGLAGELGEVLPRLTQPKAWIHRDLNPDYARTRPVQESVEQYDLILVPGEDAPFASHPRARRTSPWLIRDAEELLDRNAARDAMNAPRDVPLILVTGAGRAEEIDFLRNAARSLADHFRDSATVRFLSPQPASDSWELDGFDLWPAITLHAGVDALVGSGGYNTVHETRASRTPLLAFAQRRLYDRQHIRLKPEECVPSVDLLIAATKRLLQAPSDGHGIKDGHGIEDEATVPCFSNGVHQALDCLEALVRRSISGDVS
ncbi:MAG: hypothetical protein N2C14_15640 [Planctomycetales bacterium]